MRLYIYNYDLVLVLPFNPKNLQMNWLGEKLCVIEPKITFFEVFKGKPAVNALFCSTNVHFSEKNVITDLSDRFNQYSCVSRALLLSLSKKVFPTLVCVSRGAVSKCTGKCRPWRLYDLLELIWRVLKPQSCYDVLNCLRSRR